MRPLLCRLAAIGVMMGGFTMGSAAQPYDKPLGARIAQFLAQARSESGDQAPPEALTYGHLRVFCSQDVDQILAAGGNFSITGVMEFARGDPHRMTRAQFDQRMVEIRQFTSRAHAAGIKVISYVTQNPSTSREGDVTGWAVGEAYHDPEKWNRYADLFGPRPEEPVEEWLQRKADGSYGGFVWIPPSATHERHYELEGCPHSPGFRQYVAGIMNLLVAAGVDGIYLDHSEIEEPFSQDSQRCFREFLSARYSRDELRQLFGLEDLTKVRPAEDEADPLRTETTLFCAASEAEFHAFLRDHARQQDPDFIMAGNLYGGHGFQVSALLGRDIQIAGAVDTFLYSELATGTQTPEEGQRNLPGIRNGVKASVASLVRVLAASARTGAAISYSYYPQAPNPVPTEAALFNLQRLAMAEAFANHSAFRRVESHHREPVRQAAKTVYDLLRSVEPEMLGAEPAANVAVLASMEGGYQRRYSYDLEVSRALADAGLAHDILAPRNLAPERLARYRAIVLPNAAVLGDRDYEVLRKYQENGGSLIAFGEVGTLDNRGGPGPAQAEGRIPGLREIALNAEQAAWDNRHVGWDEGRKQHAAWARGQWPDQLRPTMEGVVAAVEQVVGDAFTARRQGPSSVEISVMRRPGSDDLIIQAVNYAVDLDGKVTPAENVSIAVCPPAGRQVARVEWHALDGVSETLPATNAAGRAQFVIPKLEIYGIAILRTTAR
jgi:hypothetical protein